MRNAFKKFFVLQQDMTDCGVACLSSILKYYGHETSLEEIRGYSGTSTSGTTLLGLKEAADKIGLKTEGYEAGIQELKELSAPCILHVIIDKRLAHFVALWKYENGKFLISDPSIGFKTLREEELEAIWQSKRLLLAEQSKRITDKKPRSGIKLFGEGRRSVNKYYNLVKNDLGKLIFSFLLGVIISILGLSVAFYTQQLIDVILPGRDLNTFVFSLAILGLILVTKNLIEYIRASNFVAYSNRFNKNHISGFFRKIIRLPKGFFDARKIGDLVARMNDGTHIQDTITYVFREFIIELLFTISILSFVTIFSLKLGVVLFGLVLVFLLVSYRYNRAIVDAQMDAMKSYANSESQFIDVIRATDAIKVGGKESVFSGIVSDVFSFYQDSVLHLDKLRNKLSFYFEAFGTITTIIIFGWAGYEYIEGRLQLGEMVAILQIVLLMIPSVIGLSLSPFYFQEAKLAFERMDELTSLAPEFTDDTQKIVPKIGKFRSVKIENLCFNFPGRLPLIKDFNLDASSGDFISIIGPTGAGKSTLFNILQKLYQPTSGSISVNNTKWEAISIPEWRSLIGVVPQDIPVFNGSLFSNIALEDDIDPHAIIAFLEEFGFDKFFKELPNEYETLIGEVGVKLSGGQKQMLGLARALYMKPQILFLDEATSSMDGNTEEFVISLLQKLIATKDLLVVFITHDARLANLANRTYYLEPAQPE